MLKILCHKTENLDAKASVAQLVEQSPCKRYVAIPFTSTSLNDYWVVAKW